MDHPILGTFLRGCPSPSSSSEHHTAALDSKRHLEPRREQAEPPLILPQATRPLPEPDAILERLPFRSGLAHELGRRQGEPEDHGSESPPLSRLVEPQLGPYRLSREMAPECRLL
jgi:hypothetical protein